MTGKVKFYDAHKRYGFILQGKGKPDVFFHESAVEGTTLPVTGHEVEFEVYPNFEEPRALHVRLLSKRAYVPINEGKRGAAYGTD